MNNMRSRGARKNGERKEGMQIQGEKKGMKSALG